MCNDTNEPRHPRRGGDAGFTLIEVLAAMIILSIGLLGLQALGISAARSNAFAQRQSEYAQHATRYVEAAVDSVSRGLITCGTATWDAEKPGDQVQRVIQGDINRRIVTVTMIPSSAPGRVRPPNYEIATHVFIPNAAAC